MSTLHFGFVPMSYRARYEATSPVASLRGKRRGITRPQQRYGSDTTTVKVAKDLEARYGIIAKFQEMESDLIARAVKNAATKVSRAAIKGLPTKPVLTNEDTRAIEARFRSNLSRQRYDSVLPGVPTQASILGISHKYAHPYAKRGPRPSFIDTGLYQASFRVWIE